ncbi:DUF2652 domain-containing protein [Hymenobacter lapidiphilus]|uniref:DUF2652 domain-containing protein n=1 Tax=Hymenobacter sp. CCM 8763 TaxID=2303334 RepID=UPI000E348C60|nr:DUF2652 domain-containing protein [Hymenobacter sp. CCM 8763]RFP65430.1 DUF2652 domain-containing protein [Hymenobacter sp. CCM 8763]
MGVLEDLRARRRRIGTVATSAFDGQQPALLFIPDISGFTRFIEQSGSPQAPFLVADLLEILIEANTLKLEVNEIQGDAVLFYRLGPPPSARELVQQCRRIYLDFQNYLLLVEQDTDSDLAAALRELVLTLKIVVHYGRVSVARIRHHTKLMGHDVIVVHRLLKNDISGAEYILLTEGYTSTQPRAELARAFAWTRLLPGSTHYDFLGHTPYHYAYLSPLRLLLNAPSLPGSTSTDEPMPGHSGRLKVRRPLSVPAEYALRVVGALRLRHCWLAGATASRFDVSKAGRLGTSYKVAVLNGQIDFQTVQILRDDDGRYTYAEKISHFRLFPNALLFFHLEPITDTSCLLTLELRYGHIASSSRLIQFGQLRRLHRFLGCSLRGLARLVAG